MKTGPVVVVLAAIAGSACAQTEVFFTDFEGGVPPQVSGAGALHDVGGYAGLGPPGNQFAGRFLLNEALGVPQPAVIVRIDDLPPHESLSVGFLLAIVDSWDGTWPDHTGPDYFSVAVDGLVVFRQTFANARERAYQGYDPPSGVALTPIPPTIKRLRNPDWADAAYDMSREPALQNMPHTARSVELQLRAEGAGWQGGLDESWAIDNLRVLVDACYADCDGSGALDLFDFLCFQNLFAAGDPAADCDGDGELTFFDFLCFQNAFSAGCP